MLAGIFDYDNPLNFSSGHCCPRCGLKAWIRIRGVSSRCFNCNYDFGEGELFGRSESLWHSAAKAPPRNGFYWFAGKTCVGIAHYIDGNWGIEYKLYYLHDPNEDDSVEYYRPITVPPENEGYYWYAIDTILDCERLIDLER